VTNNAPHPVKSNDDVFTQSAQIDSLCQSQIFQVCMAQVNCTTCPGKMVCPL
jgi:hypothetical protein